MKYLMLFFITFNVWANSWTTKCEENEQPVPWGLCVHTPEKWNGDVLFLFHGHGQNERLWDQKRSFGNLLKRHWNDEKVSVPKVVAFSFGPLWLLIEKNDTEQSGLLELVTEMVKGLQNAHGGNGRNLLLGMSMGGFNASQILLKRSELFSKVGMICPAISSLSPFAGEKEIKDFVTRTGAIEEYVRKAIGLSRYFIPREEIWNQVNPLALASTLITENSPEIYISGSVNDEYGFFEGTETFAKAAKKNKAKVDYRPMEGKHCSVDIVSLSQFILN